MWEPRAEMSSGLILVIADETPIREGVTEIMELEGLQAIAAPDGIALYQERAAEVELVLFDLSRPGLSDEEMLSELWYVDSDAHVI